MRTLDVGSWSVHWEMALRLNTSVYARPKPSFQTSHERRFAGNLKLSAASGLAYRDVTKVHLGHGFLCRHLPTCDLLPQADESPCPIYDLKRTGHHRRRRRSNLPLLGAGPRDVGPSCERQFPNTGTDRGRSISGGIGDPTHPGRPFSYSWPCWASITCSLIWRAAGPGGGPLPKVSTFGRFSLHRDLPDSGPRATDRQPRPSAKTMHSSAR